MAVATFRLCLMIIVVCSVLLREVFGIRFVIDKEECLSHNVEYEGDTVHVSFVVIKAETRWHFTEDAVDLLEHFGKYIPSQGDGISNFVKEFEGMDSSSNEFCKPNMA